jgi:hypothetical protein
MIQRVEPSMHPFEDKFMANAAPVICEERARQLAAAAWPLEGLADVRDIVKLCA